MSEPAYTRLPVDERRSQLLDLGVKLFSAHSYDELSMAQIAREAGISKALLYHYFPGKQEFFEATIAQAAAALGAITEPDPSLEPLEALTKSVDAFLSWIDANETAYLKLLQSAGSVPGVRVLIDDVRDRTAQRILEGIGATDQPKSRAAARGWLWYMDGVILDWLEHRDIEREELRDLLVGSLGGALVAAATPSGT